jgi:L-2,4-diaminobutyric acid acetyltransferase
MLMHLVSRVGRDSTLRFVEATVSPSNLPSRRLFESLAARLGSTAAHEIGFTGSDFPERDHEPEPLVRIGPIGIDEPTNEHPGRLSKSTTSGTSNEGLTA